MPDLMEIVRAALAARVAKVAKVAKPPTGPVPTPSLPSLPSLPGPVPWNRQEVSRHAPVTLARDTSADPVTWNQRVVSRLTRASDELVVHLGVDGRDPPVQRAAAMVVSASATRDMEVLQYAIAEFDLTVRRAWGEKSSVKPATVSASLRLGSTGGRL